MGPDIERFVIDGAVRDLGHLMRKQPQEERRLRLRMARKGYVPVLDITPLVHTQFNADKATFRYTITMYGVQVEDVREAEAWLNGSLVQPTLQTKLERLSNPSELMS